MGLLRITLGCIVFAAWPWMSLASTPVLKIDLNEAEKKAFAASNQLKALSASTEAASEALDAQNAALWPRLSLQANMGYLGTVPSLSVNGNLIQLTSNTSYNVGPVISYTLWDSFSSKVIAESFLKKQQSTNEELKNGELNLSASVRSIYVRAQLLLEEMRLVTDSLKHSQDRNQDIERRYRAGAAARLDLLTSQRSVLGFELQFEQRQAELSSVLKELLVLMGNQEQAVSLPGPTQGNNVDLVVSLEPLKPLIAKMALEPQVTFDLSHPKLKSKQLAAESYELEAKGKGALLYPKLQVSAQSSLMYPNGPVFQQIQQNSVNLSLSMPLFLGDPTSSLAAQKTKQAEGARYFEEQSRIDLEKDFVKAKQLLGSLLRQQGLASKDVAQSQETEELYHKAYQAGRLNLLEAQNSSLQALQAKVNAARIDANILNQMILLRSLSGHSKLGDQASAVRNASGASGASDGRVRHPVDEAPQGGTKSKNGG